MKLSLYLPVKAISLNSSTAVFKNGRRASSKQYNIFRKEVREHLDKHCFDLHSLASSFDHQKHGFKLEYTFGLTNVYLKSGKGINRKSMDVDNLIKPINDVIFAHLTKYNSNIDDSQVLKVSSEKVHSEEDYIRIKLGIIEI